MRAIFLIGVVLLAAGPGLEAQDTLVAAKDLYASAAYEDALSLLSRMDGGSTAPEIARQADEYRVFCLYALGRTEEAESIAEAMIRKDPLAQLAAADASPRLELMFADVRRRLLPSLIRERFLTARSALDKKSFTDAEPPLTDARLMLVEAEKLDVRDDGLADLSTLVDGFLELIRSGAGQHTSRRPVAAAASDAATAAQGDPPPVQEAAPSLAPTSPSPAADRPDAASPSAAVSDPKLYSVDDEDVSPPVVLDQTMPSMPKEIVQLIKELHATGVLDVVIDETGRVVDATVRGESLNMGFNTYVLRAARRWKYEPAMKDGVPVRYVKTLVLVP
jgi:TonB family protein